MVIYILPVCSQGGSTALLVFPSDQIRQVSFHPVSDGGIEETQGYTLGNAWGVLMSRGRRDCKSQGVENFSQQPTVMASLDHGVSQSLDLTGLT